MNNLNKKFGLRAVAMLLVVVMALSMAACGEKPAPAPESGSESEIISGETPINPESESSSESSSESASESDSTIPAPSESESQSESKAPVAEDPKAVQAAMLQEMVTFFNEHNPDTVGYLYVPGTSIKDIVVQSVSNNNFYLRRDKYANQSHDGCYYADWRCKLRDASNRDAMSKNTVIYGHSMEDSPNGKYFSQLKKLIDLDYAKENQFIYFSTPKEEMVWQIFAVFYANTNLPYNEPNPADDATYLNIIKEAKARSLHNYAIDVTTKDKILTLSTCTYNIVEYYPNDYRYVVMAKLLPAGAEMVPVAVEANPNPVMPK